MEPQFYTALDASELLGVSDKTVRNRIRRGEIPAEKVRLPTGQDSWQIPAEWVLERAVERPTEEQRVPPDSSGHPPKPLVKQPSEADGIAAEGQRQSHRNDNRNLAGQTESTARNDRQTSGGIAPDSSGIPTEQASGSDGIAAEGQRQSYRNDHGHLAGEAESTIRNDRQASGGIAADSSGIPAAQPSGSDGIAAVMVYQQDEETTQKIRRLGERVATLEGMAAQKMLHAIEEMREEQIALREQLLKTEEERSEMLKDAVESAVRPYLQQLDKLTAKQHADDAERVKSEQRQRELETALAAKEEELEAERKRSWWQKLTRK